MDSEVRTMLEAQEIQLSGCAARDRSLVSYGCVLLSVECVVWKEATLQQICARSALSFTWDLVKWNENLQRSLSTFTQTLPLEATGIDIL